MATKSGPRGPVLVDKSGPRGAVLVAKSGPRGAVLVAKSGPGGPLLLGTHLAWQLDLMIYSIGVILYIWLVQSLPMVV